jgi:hypothetical protein
MKKLTAIAFLITSFTITGYAQDAKANKDEKIKAMENFRLLPMLVLMYTVAMCLDF